MSYNVLDFISDNITVLVIGVISANLMGVIGYLIWLCLQKAAAKFCVERGMAFLKGIMASFIATFCLSCVLWVVYRLGTDKRAFYGSNMWLTRPMTNAVLAGVLVWIVAVIGIMIYRYAVYWKIRCLCFANMPVLDADIIKIADEWKQKLNIDKKVTVFYNDEISSPALLYYNGYQILLPTYELSREELDVVLLHELMHLKNNDIQTKNIAYIINTLFAYNPVTYLLRKQLVEWGEVNCDLCCCKLIGKMDCKDYYRCIMDLKERGGDTTQPDVIACLFEKKNMLDFRVDALGLVQESQRRHTGLYYGITTAAAVVLMVFSVGLVSYGFSYCHDKTVVSIQEEYHEEELDSTFREGSKEQLLSGAEISYWDENILYNVENIDCQHSTDFSLEPNEVKVFTLPEQVDGDLVIDVTFEGESYQVGFLGDGDRIKYMDITTTFIIKVPEKDRVGRQIFIRNTGEDTCKIELFLTEHPSVKSK